MRYLYPLSVVLVLVSTVVYFFFIIGYVGGGGLLEGSLLLLFSASFGMVCSTMYLSEISIARYRYIRIPSDVVSV